MGRYLMHYVIATSYPNAMHGIILFDHATFGWFAAGQEREFMDIYCILLHFESCPGTDGEGGHGKNHRQQNQVHFFALRMYISPLMLRMVTSTPPPFKVALTDIPTAGIGGMGGMAGMAGMAGMDH